MKLFLPDQRRWWLLLLEKYYSPSKLGAIDLQPKACEVIILLPPDRGEAESKGASVTPTSKFNTKYKQ